MNVRCVLIAALAMLAACTTGPQESVRRVTSSAAGLATDVSFCRVIQTEPGITITEENSGLNDSYGLVGTTTGAIAGGVVGSQFGGGGGQDLLTLGGAILGGLFGQAVGESLSSRLSSLDGVRYIIANEDGSAQSIVQVLDDGEEVLQPGQNCLIEHYPFNPTCYQLTGDQRGCSSSTPYQRILPFEGGAIERPEGIEFQ